MPADSVTGPAETGGQSGAAIGSAILVRLPAAVEGGVVTPAVENVGDLHDVAEDQVDDHSPALERHGAQARGEIVARAPALRQQGDAAAAFADALDVATC